jgi:outer membrane protein, multidrug efflux system
MYRPLIAALLLTVSACAPNVALPSQDIALPAQWAMQQTAFTPSVAKADWWKQLEDPALVKIIEGALKENPGLQQALSRVEAARALLVRARSDGLPQLDATGTAQFQNRILAPGSVNLNSGGFSQSGDAKTTGIFNGTLAASWELDVFGRVRQGVRGAKADILEAENRARAARVMLVGDIVQAYVDVRVAQQRRALLDRSLQTQTRLVDLVSTRAKAGIASEFELNRAKTNLGQTEAERPSSLQQEALALQQLAILSGRAEADQSWLASAGLPKLANIAVSTAPADVLRLRPDVRAAEAQVLRASADVGVAMADLYPRLTLGGDVALSESLVGAVIPGTTIIGSLAPRLSIPLWDWGSRRAVVGARQAQLKAAIYGYREQVLRAYAEAQNAMTSTARQKERLHSLEQAQKSASKALEQAEVLYSRGLTGLTERLDAESQALRTDLDLLSGQQSSASSVISLYKALSPADPVQQ